MISYFPESWYIKSLGLFCIVSFLMAACAGGSNSADNGNTANSTPAASESASRISSSQSLLPVRKGITDTNSYSDLFTDSARLEQFIAQQPMDAGRATDIRNFYRNRAYQFAWFNSDGLTEQALAFRSLYDYSKDSGTARKQLDNRLDELINNDSLAPLANDPHIATTELLMSWRFINYLQERYSNASTRQAAMEALVPYRKYNYQEWAAKAGNDNLLIARKNNWYEGLKKALQQLQAIEKKGGWESLPVKPRLFSKRHPSPFLSRLKKRLQATGQLQENDTTPVFTAALGAAIKIAQSQFGYPHDTLVTATLLKELNVPVRGRIEQVLVNMERMRWMPDLPENDVILVNIPAFTLYAMEGKTQKFSMNIIVGKEGHGTVMFSGDLNQIVFSPYWNLPPSIIEKEILPAIGKNRQYLEQQHMEITGRREGLPVIRQLPGEWNELGRIKFLFPNSMHIYFHDTPHKWLFHKDRRAYSHGCIRLAEPAKLAAWLLKDNPKWTAERIDSAMNTEKEKYLKVEHPVPVLIYYYTAWTAEDGSLQFRKDIYGHDTAFAGRLFSRGFYGSLLRYLQLVDKPCYAGNIQYPAGRCMLQRMGRHEFHYR